MGKQGKKGGDDTNPVLYRQPTETEVRDMLVTHTRLLQTLTQHERERKRATGFIVEIPVETNMGKMWVQHIRSATEGWKQCRDEEGVGIPSLGPLHCVLWRVFADQVYRSLESTEHETSDLQKQCKKLKTLLAKSIQQKSDHTGSPPSYVHSFAPLGKKNRPPPERGVWMWRLEFMEGFQRGRECEEEMVYSMEAFRNVLDVVVRRDRGPKAYVERELDEQLRTLHL